MIRRLASPATAGSCATTTSGLIARLAADIAFLLQNLADFLSDILAPVIQHVGDIFDQHGEWIKRIDVAEVFQIELRARTVTECLRMLIDLAQLRTADAGEGLAGRAAYDHVNRVFRRPQPEFGCEIVGAGSDNVASPTMLRIPSVEI